VELHHLDGLGPGPPPSCVSGDWSWTGGAGVEPGELEEALVPHDDVAGEPEVGGPSGVEGSEAPVARGERAHRCGDLLVADEFVALADTGRVQRDRLQVDDVDLGSTGEAPAPGS
jgi:hypothetical protein